MHKKGSAPAAHETDHSCRRDALDKFGVVNVQMHRLSQELRPLLHYYAVHPKVKPDQSPRCMRAFVPVGGNIPHTSHSVNVWVVNCLWSIFIPLA